MVCGKEHILKSRLFLHQSSLIGGIWERVVVFSPPRFLPIFPNTLFNVSNRIVDSVVSLCVPLSLVDSSFRALNSVFLRNITLIEHYPPWIAFRLKPNKVLNQTLWKVAVSSVMLIFKIFTSCIQDTVDCLLYYVNLENKIGHSSNCLLIRM